MKCLQVHTYIVEGDERLRAEIVPHSQSSVGTLMANITMLGKRGPKSFVKKIHRYTHAPPEDIKFLCETAGVFNADITEAIKEIDEQCEVRVRNGRPLQKREFQFQTLTRISTNRYR